MKLSKIVADVADANRVATMKVQQADGTFYLGKSGEPSTFLFVGTESETYRVNREAAVRLNLVEQADDADPDKASVKNKTVLAACTLVGWTGWEDDDESDLPFSLANAIRLLSADHICFQLWRNANKHRDFFTDSSAA